MKLFAIFDNMEKSKGMQDIRLHIHIEDTQPMELLDLTGSLVALNNQYVAYLKRHPEQNINSDAKLYIKEIRHGCVIVELIDTLAVAALPFIENANSIIGFVGYCKDAISYFLGKSSDNPGLTISDCRDFGNIVNPIAADNGAVINIGTYINGDINIGLKADSVESNAIQNAVRKEIERLSVREQTDIHRSVLMTWQQASSDIKNNAKNRGVIDSIFPGRAMKVLFDDDDIKRVMLYGEENPLTSVYVVDVKVETSQNKPIAYRIVKFHEMFES